MNLLGLKGGGPLSGQYKIYHSHHCVRPLQLDDDLSRSAQFYAEQLAQSNDPRRGDTRGTGQNIYLLFETII